jgi:hypothetical protein
LDFALKFQDLCQILFLNKKDERLKEEEKRERENRGREGERDRQ